VSDGLIDISENPTSRASLLVCLSFGVVLRGNFAAYQDFLRRSMIRTEMFALSRISAPSKLAQARENR
jgi:hypothetical protein